VGLSPNRKTAGEEVSLIWNKSIMGMPASRGKGKNEGGGEENRRVRIKNLVWYHRCWGERLDKRKVQRAIKIHPENSFGGLRNREVHPPETRSNHSFEVVLKDFRGRKRRESYRKGLPINLLAQV